MYCFPIQQWPCHDNIVTDRDLNLFHGCAVECVYLCPQEEECASSSWENSKIYIPGAIENSQTDRAPTKIDQNVAVVKVVILVELGIP